MANGLTLGRVALAQSDSAGQEVDHRQQLLDETAEVVSETAEFIRRATPLAASAEWEPGQIKSRLNAWVKEWRELRPKLIRAVDRHPSDDVLRLGHELAEDVEKLLQGLAYMGSYYTDVGAKAAVSASVIERHDHAKELADELLKKVRAH